MDEINTENTITEQAEKVQQATEELGGRAALAEKFGKTTIQFSKPFEWCGKLDKQEDRHVEVMTRLAQVEASAKQAHKRLDKIDQSEH